MKQIPKTENPLVLRTDFTDAMAWKNICQTITTPAEIDEGSEFKADVDFIDSPTFEGMGQDEILSLLSDENRHSVIFIADPTAIKEPGHPLLCVDLTGGQGKSFRVVASEVQGIENNLSAGNFDFDELAEVVDEDGVFRGIEVDF
jgi:hypothetical protein